MVLLGSREKYDDDADFSYGREILGCVFVVIWLTGSWLSPIVGGGASKNKRDHDGYKITNQRVEREPVSRSAAVVRVL